MLQDRYLFKQLMLPISIGIAAAKKTCLLRIQEQVRTILVIGDITCKAWPLIKTISHTTNELAKLASPFINPNPPTTFPTR